MSSKLAPDPSGPVEGTRALGERANAAQFDEHDEYLLDEVTRFVGAGLGAGDAVVVIATKPHLDGLEKGVKARAVDIAVACEQGRYFALDAVEAIEKFMAEGAVDEARFAEVIGGAFARAAECCAHVRAFGEMSALLCMQGNREAARVVEALRTELVATLPFSLLWAYPMSTFGGPRHGTPVLGVCGGEYFHVIPAPRSAALVSAEQRLHAITLFQQKAAALQAEVAERKEQLRRAEEIYSRLVGIVESSDDAIISKTLDGIVTSWNRGAERLFGYTAEEMIGKSIAHLMPPDRLNDIPTILNLVRRGERVDHFETERIRKDGRRIHVSVTVSPIRDTHGRIIGASKVARDVTEKWHTAHAKDEFLAMLGHELRNPLAAVQNAITAARFDKSRCERALEIARRQAAQLRRLVDDLLDVTRVTQGKIALRTERLCLATVVERAMDTARPHIDERGHSVVVSVSPEIEVDADAGRLEQVLVNLFINASKYTPPGGRIDVMAEASGEEIALNVRDNGVGISAEMLPHVFDLFAQADKSLDRAQGGLGLGLTLVRRLVELHGGEVEARSRGCGQGAEFLVRLPVARGPEPPRRANADEAGAAEGKAAARARVLLVEDDIDVADALAMLLDMMGHSVEVAHDALAALQNVQRRRPDVILVDIGLPGIDGFEVARRVRAAEGGSGILLVALTGYGRDEDKARTRAAGFDYHFTKPLEVDQLSAVVARLGGSEARPRVSSTL